MVNNLNSLLFLENDVSKIVNKVRNTINRNTQLNIMVCGAAGIGKTSFIRLFLKKFNYMKAEEVINLVGKNQSL